MRCVPSGDLGNCELKASRRDRQHFPERYACFVNKTLERLMQTMSTSFSGTGRSTNSIA